MNPDLLAGAQWQLASTPAGAVEHPQDLPPETDWVTAVVPGTVATVVDEPDPDAVDWWYSTTAALPDGSAATLTFQGVATRGTVWIDGVESAYVRSMFEPVTIEIPAGAGTVDIVVRIDSVAARMKKRRPRGRWRSSLIDTQGLRHERTTLLGRAPVYGAVPVPVGLWRPVTLRARPSVRRVVLDASAEGRVRIRADVDPGVTSLGVRIGESVHAVRVDGTDVDVTVEVPDVQLWWPHTHGEPVLYPVVIEADGVDVYRGNVGFARTVLHRNGKDVELSVNGVRVFARGGCWVPLDPVRLWVEKECLRAELVRLRDAGHNMVRVVGTLVYEQAEFWSLCAELGILVWQDVMFATTDPPEDDDFVASVEGELAELVRMVGGNPALAVVSGGSETQQQPTMLGLPAENQRMTLLENIVPEFLDKYLPGASYVTSSPSSTSGELHTHVGDGIAHYFGVGGYLRPLSDVRTARVRFAAETLAFAVPPERRSVDAMFGTANVAGHHPDWKAAVPRDRGSSWDFEDVRDHYVRDIFGVDPHLVRRTDAELYLDYGRAAVCEAVTASYSHWRSAESECAGALVLTLRDLVSGAGWGLIDASGTPKAPWYSLARLSRPVAVFVVDDGLDGPTVQIVDDTAEAVTGTLRVTLYGDAGPVGDTHERPVHVPAHNAAAVSLDSIVGSFADINHAYRFGARTYSAMRVELLDGAGSLVTDATHLIADSHPRQNDVGLSATVQQDGPGRWALTVSTTWAAQHVCVDVDGFDIDDSWFHMAPASSRVIILRGDRPKPTGHVRALNSIKRAQIV